MAANQPSRWSISILSAVFLSMLLLTDLRYLLLALTSVITFLFLRHLMFQRIGGTTGDTAGAVVEITETTVLLISVITLNTNIYSIIELQ